MKKILAIAALVCSSVFAQPLTQEQMATMYQELQWLPPGGTGMLAGKASFKASKSYTFLSPADTDKFLRINGNPPQGGKSVTIAPTQGDWFGILHFSPEGYVKDDESIDADALLKSLKENNEAANEYKRKAGYLTLRLQGWALPPRYDRENKRLEWGTLLLTDDNQTVANVSTRILGRSGFTEVTLVTTPETLAQDLADFKVALRDFEYVAGERYSEWKQGDKVAAYGLGALVLGGAAAAASSKGGFKALGLAALAGLAALWAGIKRLFTRKKS